MLKMAFSILLCLIASQFVLIYCEDDFFGADSLPESQRVIVYQALIYGSIACIGILIIGVLVTICVWAYLRHKASIHPIGIALPTHGYSALDKYAYIEDTEASNNQTAAATTQRRG